MNQTSIEEIHRRKDGKVSDKWASYLPFYDELFSVYRNQPIDLLEIGVQNGGSLETWSTYFIGARALIGCDINPLCGELKYSDSRVSVVVGDANQQETLNRIRSICERFDIVIDDGSHHSNDILNSFLIYFQLLKPGGLYVIEDTHTLYMTNFGGGILNEFSAYSFFKKMVDIVNLQFWEKDINPKVYFRTFFPPEGIPDFISEGWVESVEFRNSLIVVRKSLIATNDKLGKRIVSGREASVNPAPLGFKD